MNKKPKFPCSSVAKLLVGLKEFTASDREKALEKISKKKKHRDGTLGKQRWTDKDQQTLTELLEKRSLFELGETAKSYIFDRWKYKEKGVKKWMDFKQTLKGKLKEEEALEILDEVYPVDQKRELGKELLSNEYLVGVEDIFLSLIAEKRVEDIKAPFTKDNFLDVLRKIDDEVVDATYFGQGQAYMELLDVDNFWLCYVGVNTPIAIMDKEIMFARRFYGIGSEIYGVDMREDFDEAALRIENLHTFDDMEMEDRVIVAKIKRDRKYMRKLERVIRELAWPYYNLLIKYNGRIPKDIL